ncbi:ATP phosphoribosyltransferase regulatory subunit [Tumebacillus algifaecis]|uniref:ATP phosphoribosyltransferase regulatory subunit n=1 Tax=Tumebacillus algifaecis TaxID=1214604 RepID=UPI0012FD391C|nr:ATP phosphoribosyltransferase regulatory subunit [Tumebacillus algifaecis]
MDQPIRLEKPRGVRDVLPPLAARKREVEKKIAGVFQRWGYEEIVTPTFEYADTFLNGAFRDEEDSLFKSVDRSGRTVALRPDMTAPIARVVSSLMKEKPLPIRLSYNASIFRQQHPEAGRDAEFTQAGVELMGDGSPDADAGLIALAASALQAAGVKGFRLEIGQVQFVQALLAEHVGDDNLRGQLSDALVAKEYVRYEQLVQEQVESEASRGSLLKVPHLRGGIAILADAAAITSSAQALAALDNLRTIWEILVLYNAAEHAQIDLSLLLSRPYYTGAIFEGYGPNVDLPICSGGRYDELVGRFGRAMPATGFMIGIERVLHVLEKSFPKDPKERFLILYEAADRYPVIGFATYLRSKRFIITAQHVDDVEAAMKERSEEHVTLIPFKGGKLLESNKLLRAMFTDFCHMFSL